MDLLTAFKLQEKLVGTYVTIHVPMYFKEPVQGVVTRQTEDTETGWWLVRVDGMIAQVSVYYREVIDWDRTLEEQD